MSKFLNAPLFAKKLEFFYKSGDSLKVIDPLKPIGDQEEIIDFKTSPIEIDVKIEHIGAWSFLKSINILYSPIPTIFVFLHNDFLQLRKTTCTFYQLVYKIMPPNINN